MFAAAADWYYSWLEQGTRRNLMCLTIRGWSKHFFGSFVSTAVAAVAIAVVVVDAIVELGVVAADVDFVGETFVVVVASVIVVVVSAAAVVVAVDAIVVIVAVVSVVDVEWGFDFDAKVEEIVVVVASVSAVDVVAVDDIQEKQKRHQHVEI